MSVCHPSHPTLYDYDVLNHTNYIFHESFQNKFFQSKFLVKVWDFVPRGLTPSPNVGIPKKEKINDVYFAFYAILSILFFHENFHFFGWDWLGLRYIGVQ